MALLPKPTIRDMNPAPDPANRRDFNGIANVFFPKMPGLADDINLMAGWIEQETTNLSDAVMAADASAGEASDSALLATQNGAAQVVLAADQVTLASLEADRSEFASNISVGAANFQGEYNAATTYQIGQSVSFDNKRFVAKTVNIGITPIKGVNWIEIGTTLEIGDFLKTARSGVIDGFLPADGSVYLQSAYPDLFANVGTLLGENILRLANPDVLPPSTGLAAAFSADGVYLAVGYGVSPFITIYKRSGDTFTKLANPTVLPASTANDAAFSADGIYLAVAHAGSPHVTIYKRSGDTFTKLANPGVLPPSTANGVAFSADGVYLAVAHSMTPYVTIYKRSGDTFTKLTDPDVLPSNTGTDATFSADGIYLAVGHGGTPHVMIYKRSGDTFTKLANPDVLPPGTVNGVAFSADGVYLATAHISSPLITIYKRSGDTFTKLPDPDVLPPNNANDVAFSADGVHLAIVNPTAPFVLTYKRFGDTFTKPASSISLLPPASGNGVTLSADGVYLAIAHSGGPFITIYNTANYDVSTEFRVPFLPGTEEETYIKAE